jgi:glycosyltransferase involved in cell wall biosynthesis
MTVSPTVDVNLIVYNSVNTIDAVIESILGQTWPAVTLTVIDNGSDDGTLSVVERFANERPDMVIKRNRCNTGPVANLQRAFWFGDADFVMPKTGDDLIAPNYIERLMGVLLEHPTCAMCHAAGQVFTETNQIVHSYPPEHLLTATGADPVARAQHVMQHYTTAPSFWGVYRRAAVDRLSMLRYRAGMDHAVLAELALYGEIRHVAEPLFHRHGGGKPVVVIARAMTEHANRGVPLDDVLADQRWRTPLITTAYAHMEVFAVAPLPLAQRLRLLQSVQTIFRARWLLPMRREAAQLRGELPGLLQQIATAEPMEAACLARSVTEVLHGAQAIVPEEDFTLALLEVAAVYGEVVLATPA